METGSFLGIYTGIFSWHFYDLFMSVITDFGLWIIPIILILWGSTITLARNNGRSDPQATLVQSEIEIYAFIFIVALAAIPSIPVDKNLFQHNNLSAGNTQTTYDDLNATTPSSVRMPILWYVAWRLNAAITYTVKTALPTGTNLREMMTAFHHLTIDDPALSTELEGFNAYCAAPATKLFKALQSNPSTANSRLVSEVVSRLDTGADPDASGNINYPGNDAFTEVLYDPSIPYCARDADPVTTLCIPPVGIRLHHSATELAGGCQEWWGSTGSGGLKDQLYQHMAETRPDDIGLLETGSAALGIDTLGWVDDAVNRSLTASPLDKNMSPYRGEQAWYSALTDWGSEKVLAATLHISTLITDFFNEAIVNYLPILHAMVMFLLVLFLPIMQLLGRFSWESTARLLVLFFTISMWIPVWYVIGWLDNVLLSTMYGESGIFDTFFNLGHALVSLVVFGLYTYVPFKASQIVYYATSNGVARMSNDLGGIGGTGGKAGGHLGGQSSQSGKQAGNMASSGYGVYAATKKRSGK